MLEVNPRASRTVPFASKATGVNLVDAACRLAAGARIADLGLPPERCRRAGQRQGGRAAVRALPRRRPGARAGDALDRRGDGERGRLRDRVREGRARRRAAAADRRHGVPVRARRRQGRGRAGRARRSPGSGSGCSRPPARRARSPPPASPCVARSTKGDAGRRPHPRRGAATSSSTRRRAGNARTRRLPDPRGGARRARAVHHDARRRARRGRRDRERARPSRRSRSRSGSMPRRERVVASSARRGGRAVHARSASTAAGSSPGVPGQFFMLEAPGRVLPRPMSLCLAPRGELAFLIDPIGPGTRGARGARAGRRDRGLRPARERLPARRRRGRCSSAAASASRRCPYLSEALGRPPAVLGFRSE